MKLTQANAARAVTACLFLGVLSLISWVVLVLVPGKQGEFFFFYLGFQFTIVIPVLHYRMLQFEDPRSKEGLHG